jgi:hypothetical protein
LLIYGTCICVREVLALTGVRLAAIGDGKPE